MKRIYFLVAIASLQILLGSVTLIGAAQPVRMSQNALAPTSQYYLFEFGILGTGHLSGNLSELQGQSFTLFVFDDAGYASFRDGSNSVAPLFRQSGTTVVVDMNLTGSGQYHVVAVDIPARRELQLHVELVVFGLKTGETIVALIVLVGGMALLAASLMLSVWSSRRAAPARSPDPASNSSSDPLPDPLPDPPADPDPDPPQAPNDPPDDNTRIY